MGRVRTKDKNASRTIDFDIILFEGQLLDPTLWQQVHQAVPVAELFPDYPSKAGERLKDVANRLAQITPIELRQDVSDSQRKLRLPDGNLIMWPTTLENLLDGPHILDFVRPCRVTGKGQDPDEQGQQEDEEDFFLAHGGEALTFEGRGAFRVWNHMQSGAYVKAVPLLQISKAVP